MLNAYEWMYKTFLGYDVFDSENSWKTKVFSHDYVEHKNPLKDKLC